MGTNETVGEQAVALNYLTLSEDKMHTMKKFKSRIASIIDDMQAYKVDNNAREIAIAHTNLETASMFLSKAIIKYDNV